MSLFMRLGPKAKCLRLTGGIIVPINRNMSVNSIDLPFLKTSQRQSYVHQIENKSFIGITMGEVIDQSVDRYGDRIAVVDRPQQIRKTFHQLHNDIDKLATGFLALNLHKGDRIGIWSPNRYEWILTQMASYKTGLIVVPINAVYQQREFEYCLRKLQLKALVAPESFRIQEYYKIINEVVPEVVESKPGQIKSKNHPYFNTLIMLSEKDIPGAFKFQDVLSAGGSQEKEELKRIGKEIQIDDPLMIFFTSGTTGLPKASIHTHFTIVNNCLNVNERLGHAVQSRQNRICCSLPFFHIFGGIGISCTMMTNGVGVIMPAPGYVAEACLKAIEEEKCTSVYGTPTMFYDLMNHPNFSKTDLSSVTGGVIGGDACKPELLRSIIKNFNAPEISCGYGATEFSVLTVHQYSAEGHTKEESVGPVIPNVEVKIVDENGLIVPIGTPGELCVRGYSVHKGYWDDEQSSKDAVKDNWFYSGDIAVLTEDDRIKITGRKKDIIKRGGTNILPAEIEMFLKEHPKIVEACVFGVFDERLGEEICAYVRLHENQSLNETEVKEFCKGKLSYFKIPRYVHFVKDFPRTAIGKPQKFIMREEIENILKSNKTHS